MYNTLLYLETKLHGEIQQNFNRYVQTQSAINSAQKRTTKSASKSAT